MQQINYFSLLTDSFLSTYHFYQKIIFFTNFLIMKMLNLFSELLQNLEKDTLNWY